MSSKIKKKYKKATLSQVTELQTELGREKERASVRNIKNEIIVENECRVNKIQLSELRIDTNLSIETLGPSPIVKVYLGCRWVRGRPLIPGQDFKLSPQGEIFISLKLRWKVKVEFEKWKALTTRWNIHLSQVEITSESEIWNVKSPDNKGKHLSLSSWGEKWKVYCLKPRRS